MKSPCAPNKIDYLNKKLSSKIKTFLANKLFTDLPERKNYFIKFSKCKLSAIILQYFTSICQHFVL